MKKLDRFILREVVSDGPAGTVYRADEVLPGDNRRAVALKVLPRVDEGTVAGESEPEQRFFGEVRLLAQLAVHPNIVTIYAMGLTDGYPWLAMEYSAGTLAQKIADAPGSPEEIARVLEQVGRGLAAMHALKPPLVHQDLKPGNVLVDRLGNCKITDFSLASVTAANKTHGLATVRYAAPELLSNEFGSVGPGTDLYALGHMAYEMALGMRLHRQQFRAVFEGNAGKEPPPNKWMMWHASIGNRTAAVAEVVRGFPSGLSEVIGRLMAKAPGERYGSAEEMLSDLSVLKNDGGPMELAPAPVRAPTATGEAAGKPAPAPSSAPLPLEPAPVEMMEVVEPAETGATAAGNSRYWVRLRGKVTGPFDMAALQRQVKQRQLSRLHQVSADQVNWNAAGDMAALWGPSVV